MKKSSAFICSFLLILSTTVFGEVFFNFSDGDVLPTSTIINPGDSFSFDISVSSDSESFLGLTYFLTIDAAGSGKFSITNRVTTGSQFSALATSNGVALTAGNALLNPQNNNDLGGTIDDIFTPLVPATYYVSTITITSTDPLPNSSYTIGFSPNSISTDENFNDVTPTKGTYTVNVIPEPTTLLLFGLGLTGLLVRRRR